MMAKKLSKKTGLPLGEYVSRSTYNKVAERNKKLLADIKILVEDIHPLDQKFAHRIILIKEWREKFKKDNWLIELLQEMAHKSDNNKQLL